MCVKLNCYNYTHTGISLLLPSLTELVERYYNNLIFLERLHFHQVVEIILTQFHYQHNVVLHFLT